MAVPRAGSPATPAVRGSGSTGAGAIPPRAGPGELPAAARTAWPGAR